MRMSNNNQTALTNVEIFTDVVKDRICDWIYYHHCQPDRDLVDIRDLVFTKKLVAEHMQPISITNTVDSTCLSCLLIMIKKVSI